MLMISTSSVSVLEDEVVFTEDHIPRLVKNAIRQSLFTPKETWCIAKNTVDDSTLQSALDYACGQTTADCNPIKLGGLCFFPNTVVRHASYVFNSYYQINAKGSGTCSFNGAAVVTTEDPSEQIETFMHIVSCF
ncbi:hypothetical protein KP509_1Z247200 [Ceratopteris richardii]|nr:hypothetical protein KP509_1Z247200 [Ceratopteris richardii]